MTEDKYFPTVYRAADIERKFDSLEAKLGTRKKKPTKKAYQDPKKILSQFEPDQNNLTYQVFPVFNQAKVILGVNGNKSANTILAKKITDLLIWYEKHKFVFKHDTSRNADIPNAPTLVNDFNDWITRKSTQWKEFIPDANCYDPEHKLFQRFLLFEAKAYGTHPITGEPN